MSADFDHRLIDTLNAVAEQTETSKNWERVVADARPIRSRPAAPVFKSAPFAVAAIVATLAGLGVAFWLGTGDSEVTVAGPIDYLLPGEQLVRDDPLIVVSAPGPESQFPTGDLGTEVHLGVIDGVDDRTSEIISSIQELVDGWPGSSIVKITLLGEIRGDPWLLVFVDGPDGRGIDDGGDPDANFRVRLLVGPDGGHGQGDLAPVDGLYLIALPTITEGPTEALLTYGPWDGWISWDLLPAEAAVVTYTDTERQFWIRPRAGAAILPVQLQAGETFTLEVLDTTGKTISTRTETVAEDYIAAPKDASPEYYILMPETD